MPAGSALWFQVLTFMFAATAFGDALRLKKVSIPGYKLRGEMAILECDYELDGEVLYAVKWYKDNEEFYRFVPKSNPPQHSYKVDGIKVDVSMCPLDGCSQSTFCRQPTMWSCGTLLQHQLSDSKQVVLRGVNLKSSGLYRCEVSAEAPSFSSAHEEGRMDVVYLPKDGPHITGEEKEYQVGDQILLNCTSGKSYPASALHWYINNHQMSDPDGLVRYPIVVHPHGLLTTTLGLRLHVTNGHFQDGQMRVKCVASVSPVLWQGNRESVVQRMAPLIDNREAHFLVKGAARGNGEELSGMLVLVSVLCARTLSL